MAEREIIWTTTAASQRRVVLKYWTERNNSPAYAKKLIKIIRKRTSVLSKYPDSGKDADFLNTKVSALGHYSIFYKIMPEQIIITAFWDNRQSPDKLLELLKK